MPVPSRNLRSCAALSGAAWAMFLLPPQVVGWSGLDAPAWARSLDEAAVYDVLRRLDGVGGLDAYAWSGILIAPSWLLIGWALLTFLRRAGRLTGGVAFLLLLGAPVSIGSYLAADASRPWNLLWGTEALVLLSIAILALPAGVVAIRRRRVPTWWGLLLAATGPVWVASTLVLTYYPHGSLVGIGLETALLARLSTAPPPSREATRVLAEATGGISRKDVR